MLGGYFSSKVSTFWMLPLRMYVGVIWLIEGINKVKDGWLNPNNIFIVSTAATSGASQAAEAGQTTANAVVPLLSQPPAFYTWFMNTFVSPFAFIFQAMVVIMEIGIGLALIGGLFTFLASLASIFMALNFILSAMAGKEILWYIFAGIALMGGAGRAFGLDYYVMPWIKKWWNKTKFARKTYLFID
jgi:NADH dehydrogenase